MILPNAEHVTVTAILELLPSVNTYIYEVLQAKERLRQDQSFLPPRTVEERSVMSVKLMEAADIPRFNWSIDSETGDITVQSEVPPLSVHVWHASTCNTERRD